MKLEHDLNLSGINKITAYTAGSIVISEKVYTSSLILSPDKIIDDWQPESILQMGLNDLDQILSLGPELVLLGTGTGLFHPSHEIIFFFHSRNIGIEIMDTGAACRAFNFLLGEGRQVVAALFMPGNQPADTSCRPTDRA